MARLAILGIVMIAATGCASAPVQEMSNARQAVRAAHEGVASKETPASLSEADTLLLRAESSMRVFRFREAREYAVQARGKAIETLQNLQATPN